MSEQSVGNEPANTKVGPVTPDDGPESTDAELLRRAAFDPTSFRMLYNKHSETIFRFVLRRVGDHEAALEITAETFARAWLGRDKFTDIHSGNALPWMYGIAANVIRESVRRQQLANRATQRLGMTLGIHHGTCPLPSWTEGLDEDLQAALESLPEEQRRAVELRVLDDESYETVAERLDCSQGAARIRVSRGLRGIRKIFGEDPNEH